MPETPPPGRGRRRARGLVVIFALVALGTGPLLRVSSTRLAVSLAVLEGYTISLDGPGPAPLSSYTVTPKGVDPWGHTLAAMLVADTSSASFPQAVLHSIGPNGTDERGEGDDIRPSDTENDGTVAAYLGSRFLGAAALFLAWMLWGPYATRARGTLKKELVRALVLASLPACLPFLLLAALGGPKVVWVIFGDIWSMSIPQFGPMPFGIAFWATWLIVFWMLALAWRLRHPEEGEPLVSESPRTP